MELATTYRNLFALTIVTVLALFATACATTDPYASISVGDSREKVVSLLGEPVNPAKDLTAAELKTIAYALKKTHSKNSESFSIWRHDSNHFYLVGFGKRDTVAVKHKLQNRN